MLNVLYLSFIEDKINSSQLVINHFLILKRSGFLFFYGAAFKESSPSNLNTGICNMERREGQPYFSRGPCYLLHVSGWLFKSLNCLLQKCVKKKLQKVKIILFLERYNKIKMKGKSFIFSIKLKVFLKKFSS